jgi:hypothetical protein
LQNTPSEHGVLSATNALGGHVLPLPSQLSATSQTPLAARQTAVLLASAGQLMVDPSQFSTRSQAPAAGRQTVLLEATWSGGQAALLPVQFSTASQI